MPDEKDKPVYINGEPSDGDWLIPLIIVGAVVLVVLLVRFL